MYCLIFTGHIRDSFNDDRLYDFIKELNIKSEFQLEIYFQTWIEIEAKKSWRNLEKNKKIITKTLVKNYFKDLSYLIKEILILDDTTIKHYGKIDGKIIKSLLPIICIKNWWYGKKEITNLIPNKNYIKVISIRPDILDIHKNNNIVCFLPDEIINNILYIQFYNKRINLLKKKKKVWQSCDSYLAGNLNNIKEFTNYFYNNIDIFDKTYKNIKFQEATVFYEALRNNFFFYINEK